MENSFGHKKHGVNAEVLVPFLPFWCHVIRLGTWHGLLVWGYGAQHMISVFLEPHAGTNVSGESLSCNHLIEAALGFLKNPNEPRLPKSAFLDQCPVCPVFSSQAAKVAINSPYPEKSHATAAGIHANSMNLLRRFASRKRNRKKRSSPDP